MKSGFLHPRFKNFASVFVSALALGPLAVRPAHGTDYALTADASKVIGTMPRYWQEAVGSCHIYMTLNSAQGINFKEHFRMAATELGMKRIRAHGILNDDVGIYKETGGVVTYNWTKVDAIFDYLVSIGMEPVVEMSFMPKDLASGPATFGWYGGVPGNISPPKDYDKWRELCYRFARHVTDRYGAAKVSNWYFEIWNEPDLKQFFSGTKEDYFRMYDFAVEGILRALPDAKVGGPSIAISGGTWVDDFLEHCMTRNFADPAKSTVKVDFVTWHTYPGNSGQAGIFGAHNNVSAKIKAKKAKYPALAHVKNFLTEYNTSYQGGDTYNNEIGASFVAKVAHSMFPDQNGGNAPPDMAAYWVVSDLWEEWDHRSNLAFGPMGMILRKHNVRKPNYMAFQMMNMMSDSLVAVSGGTKAEPGLSGWATVDKARGRMQILIYDHNRGDGDDIPQAYLDKVVLDVANIPFGSGRITVQRFAVDRNQNNSFRIWEKGGKPAFPSEALWTEMANGARLSARTDGFKATQAGDSMTLEFDQYQPGVTLFVLGGDAPVGLEDGSRRTGSASAAFTLAVRLRKAGDGMTLSGLARDVASVEIKDLQGRSLRSLRHPASGGEGSGHVYWDRRDRDGRRVPRGTVLAVVHGPFGRASLQVALTD